MLGASELAVCAAQALDAFADRGQHYFVAQGSHLPLDWSLLREGIDSSPDRRSQFNRGGSLCSCNDSLKRISARSRQRDELEGTDIALWRTYDRTRPKQVADYSSGANR